MSAPINPRLRNCAIIFVLGCIALGVFGPKIPWPFHHVSTPTIATAKFREPEPTPTPPLVVRAAQAIMATPAPTPAAKATARPCLPCQQAAQEVLTRYLERIHTGAGSDEQEDQKNVFEVPSIYPTPHPVWTPSVLGDNQLHR